MLTHLLQKCNKRRKALQENTIKSNKNVAQLKKKEITKIVKNKRKIDICQKRHKFTMNNKNDKKLKKKNGAKADEKNTV